MFPFASFDLFYLLDLSLKNVGDTVGESTINPQVCETDFLAPKGEGWNQKCMKICRNGGTSVHTVLARYLPHDKETALKIAIFGLR